MVFLSLSLSLSLFAEQRAKNCTNHNHMHFINMENGIFDVNKLDRHFVQGNRGEETEQKAESLWARRIEWWNSIFSSNFSIFIDQNFEGFHHATVHFFPWLQNAMTFDECSRSMLMATNKTSKKKERTNFTCTAA